MYLRLSLVALLLSAVLVLSLPLAAQEVRQVEKVSLRTDQALDIFLDVIRDSKEKKDWKRAQRALNEIERFIETNGEEYILPVSDSPGRSEGLLYTFAREAAYRELATFPEEALASWRLSADCAVCDALADCRLSPDARQLEQVITRYPLSSFSPEALGLLSAIHLERGDFAQALRACTRAKAYFPNLPESEKARFELLRILCLCGLTGSRPERLIAGFNSQFANLLLPFRGKTAPATEALERSLDSIKLPGARYSALPGGVGTPLWSAQFPPSEEMENLFRAAENSDIKAGLRTAPVAAGSRILLCDESRLVALDAPTGDVLWSHAAPASPTSSSIHSAFRRPASDGKFAAASLGSRLHVFDLANGALKWSEAPGRTEDTTHIYLSSPCIYGNTVVLGATAWGKEMTCSLLAYDLETGSLRWKRRIQTGFPTDTFGLGSQPGPPVVWGGAAYFVTNMGAAVCCRLETGTILWLRRYAVGDPPLKEESIKAGRRWELLPPVVHRGVFVAAPQDSPFLFAADAVDGKLLWQEPRVGIEEFRYLSGASGRLVFASGSAVRAFHYRTGKVAWTCPLPAPASGPPAVFSERLIVPCGHMLATLSPQYGRLRGNYLLPDALNLPQHAEAVADSLIIATPWLLKRFASHDESTKEIKRLLAANPADPSALLKHGSLLWRNGEPGRGIASLESALANIADAEEQPLKAQIMEELEFAARAAAEAASGEERGKLLETAAKYSNVSEQPSLLLEAAKVYEDAGLPEKALRVCREMLLNHQARNVIVAGHKVHADDYARISERRILEKAASLRDNQEKLASTVLAAREKTGGPYYLFEIIRTFPNSRTAARAYIELGEYCLKEKLLESAELYLSEFLARNPRSALADQAKTLLCETYLGKTDFPRAKQLLLALAKSESTVKLGNTTRKASDYASAKLTLPSVAKVDLAGSLILPVSRLWQTTPFLAERTHDIIGLSPDGRVLFTLGPTLLDCRCQATGALLARFDLSDPPQPPGSRRGGVVVTGGVVILRGKRLVMVSTQGKEPEWKWGATLPPPDRMPGITPREDALLGKTAGCVLVLWPRNRLMAFDAKTGARLWTHKSPLRFLDFPVEIGGKLVLLQADGNAAVCLDPKTGAEKFKTRLEGAARAASSIIACGDRVLVVRGSKDLYCVGVDGNISWVKSMADFVSVPVYLAPDKVALMPGPGAPRNVTCLSLADGHELWKAQTGADPVITQLADESRLYVVQRPRFGRATIAAFDASSGKRQWVWRQPQGSYGAVRQTPTHILVAVADRMLSQLCLVDKARGVQEQSLVFPAEMYQSGFIRRNRLYVTTDRCAYCFGEVKRAQAREEYVQAVYRLVRTSARRREVEKLAAKYAQFQAFDNAGEALDEIIRSDWKLPEMEIRRLLERAGGFHYGHDRTRPRVIEAREMARPVKADGLLDDGWIPALAIRRGLGHVFKVDRPQACGEWFSKHDLSATIYFGWDKENFYLALDVRDSITRPWDRDEKEFWKGDLLLIALDPLGDGGQSARADDVLLSMGLVLPRRNLTPEEQAQEERNKPKGEYFVKRREDGSGAVYEAKIPWELFNENGTNIDSQNGPPEGFSFGLDLILLDDDTGGGTTKTLNLARGLLLGRRNALWRAFVPDNFATIRLKGK